MSETVERRREHRHSVYLAAEVFIDDTTTRPAITMDVSAQGLLVLTRSQIAVDQVVKLTVYLPGDDDRVLLVSGRVVRHEKLAADERGTWRDKVAMVFDEPQPQLAEEYSALAEEQGRLYGWER